MGAAWILAADLWGRGPVEEQQAGFFISKLHPSVLSVSTLLRDAIKPQLELFTIDILCIHGYKITQGLFQLFQDAN